MGKYFLLIASCFFTSQLIPAPLPSFPASSLTLDQPGSGGGCLDNIAAAGANFSISGLSGSVCSPELVTVGSQLFLSLAFPLTGSSQPSGTITLNGVQYAFTPSGSLTASPNGPGPIVSSGTSALTIPATATGTLVAACSLGGFHPCATRNSLR